MSGSESSTDGEKLKCLLKEEISKLKKADRKKAQRSRHEFKYKGNAKQAEFNEAILEKLRDLKGLMKSGSTMRSMRLLKEVIKDHEKRLKHIKIADRSAAGWKTVHEYLSDDLASSSGDEKRIRKAEERALAKAKRDKGKAKVSRVTPKIGAPSSTSGQRIRTGRPDRQFEAKPGPSKESDQCFRCGRFGHHRRDCYAKTRGTSSYQG